MFRKKVLDQKYVLNLLRPIIDPDLNVSIVKLGLIVDIIIKDSHVDVQMTLTTPNCPYGPFLISKVKSALEKEKMIQACSVHIVWPKRKHPFELTDMQKLDMGIDI